MEKLRECPFCGGIPAQDIIKDSYYRNRYTIECGTCGLQMWDIAKDSLYRSWNTRHEQKHETVEEWINVKDRLPENEQVVFSLWNWGRQGAIYENNVVSYTFYSHDIPNRLTHWMPLPPKPNSIGER